VIEILVFAGIPALLLVLLSMLGATWKLNDDSSDDMAIELRRRCASGPEMTGCVQRIFSPADRDFVDKQGSPRLRQIYRAERTRVALYWVRMASSDVSEIMREHRLAARQSSNLEVAREIGLTLRYAEFRILCGMLVVSIRLLGPHALQDLATYALDVSQAIGRVLDESTAGGRIQAAGNLGGA
jgi:hypothetical protein